MRNSDRRRVRRSVTIDGVHLDSFSMKIEKDHVDASDLLERMSPPAWDGELLEYDLRRGSSGSAIAVGFYELEEFGTWSRQARPYLILDRMIEGKFVLSIEARAFGANIGNPIMVTIGDCTRRAVFDEVPSVVEFHFEVTQPAHVIEFEGVIARSDPTVDDPRSMGVGLTQVEFRRPVRQSVPLPGERVVVDVSDNNVDDILVGFHAPEAWGAWTGQDEAWIQVPELSPGIVEVDITCRAHGASEGRHLVLECGGSTTEIPIGDQWGVHTVRLEPVVSTAVLHLKGWCTALVEGSDDSRPLGIGLQSLVLTQVTVQPRPTPSRPGFTRRRLRKFGGSPRSASIDTPGTTFLVPIDGDANDPSNSDVVIAFLYAYRRDENAVLFLVCSLETIADVFSDVLYLLARVEKCACRIVVVPRNERGLIPPRLFAVSDVFVRTPTAKLGPDDLAAVWKRRLVVVAPRNRMPEALTGSARAVVVPLRRQPDRIPGDEHGYRRSLVDVVSWDDLVDAVTRAGELATGVKR